MVEREVTDIDVFEALGTGAVLLAGKMEAQEALAKAVDIPVPKAFSNLTTVLGAGGSTVLTAIDEFRDSSASKAIVVGVLTTGATLLLTTAITLAIPAVGLGAVGVWAANLAASTVGGAFFQSAFSAWTSWFDWSFDQVYDLTDRSEPVAMIGTPGADRFRGSPQGDGLFGGAKGDDINGNGGADVLVGEGGDDTLDGGPAHDILIGGIGADRLIGGKGDDSLFGDTIAPRATGREARDTLRGGEGDDVLDAGRERDFLYGEQDDDQLVVRAARGGVYDGGRGRDTLVSALLSLDLNRFRTDEGIEEFHIHDTLDGGDTASMLKGRAFFSADILTGNDFDNVLLGRNGGDTLTGEGGDDTLDGGAGDDSLWGDRPRGDGPPQPFGDDSLLGGGGEDRLLGGPGDDTLQGGADRDWLSGGPGLDLFQDTPRNLHQDRITDLGLGDRLAVLRTRLDQDDIREGTSRIVIAPDGGLPGLSEPLVIHAGLPARTSLRVLDEPPDGGGTLLEVTGEWGVGFSNARAVSLASTGERPLGMTPVQLDAIDISAVGNRAIGYGVLTRGQEELSRVLLADGKVGPVFAIGRDQHLLQRFELDLSTGLVRALPGFAPIGIAPPGGFGPVVAVDALTHLPPFETRSGPLNLDLLVVRDDSGNQRWEMGGQGTGVLGPVSASGQIVSLDIQPDGRVFAWEDDPDREGGGSLLRVIVSAAEDGGSPSTVSTQMASRFDAGGPEIRSISFAPDGTLYALGRDASGADGLFVLDPDAGLALPLPSARMPGADLAATSIDLLGVPDASGLIPPASDLIAGSAEDDVIDGGRGDDGVDGGPGDDRISGGRGHDALAGGTGDDSLGGGAGDDLLSGGSGRDVLDGGPGADTLAGGAPGADRMTGGPGPDVFVVPRQGADRVTDFDSGADRIRVPLPLDAEAGETTVSVRAVATGAEVAVAGGGRLALLGATPDAVRDRIDIGVQRGPATDSLATGPLAPAGAAARIEPLAPTARNENPVVAPLADGRFLVAWEGLDEHANASGLDGVRSGRDVSARRLSADAEQESFIYTGYSWPDVSFRNDDRLATIGIGAEDSVLLGIYESDDNAVRLRAVEGTDLAFSATVIGFGDDPDITDLDVAPVDSRTTAIAYVQDGSFPQAVLHLIGVDRPSIFGPLPTRIMQLGAGTVENNGLPDPEGVRTASAHVRVQPTGESSLLSAWVTSPVGADDRGTLRLGALDNIDAGPLTNRVIDSSGALLPEFARLDDGRVVLVWVDTDGADGPALRLQLLTADGTSLGPVTTVATLAGADQPVAPAISALETGGFAIAWPKPADRGPDQVLLQRFDGEGASVGPAVRAASVPKGDGRVDTVGIAGGTEGRLVLVYEVLDAETGRGWSQIQLLAPENTANADGTVYGTDGADLVRGTARADILAGGGGGDDVIGAGGDDVLSGDHGDDRLSGDGGRDSLQGGPGADTLLGGPDADRLSGGNGDDYLDGGPGSDRLAGDAGADTFVWSAGRDRLLDFDPTVDVLAVPASLVPGPDPFARLRDAFARTEDGAVLRLDGSEVRIDEIASWAELHPAIDIV